MRSSGSPAPRSVDRGRVPSGGRVRLLAGSRPYEEQAANLGLDFVAAAEATCERIVQFSGMGRPFDGRLGRVLVPRFPYDVIYRTEDGHTVVVAVANLYRRPGYWHTRT